MWNGWLDALFGLELQDRAFAILAVAIAVLLLATAGFAVLTLALRYRNRRRAERWSRLEAAWERLLLDVLAGDEEPEALRRRVDDGDRSFFVDFLLRYAERVRGAELERIRALARPYLGTVAEQLDADEPMRRALAVRTLATLGSRDHTEAIVRALDDPSPVVTMAAAHALAEEGGPSYAAEILDRLDRYELWSAPFVTQLLVSMGDAAVPDVERVYADPDAPPEARAVCADALSRIGPAASADLAAEVLAKLDLESAARTADETTFGDERELLIASLKLLARLGRPEHVPLVRRLARAPDPIVRAMAVTALGELGGAEDRSLLTSALRDPARWVALHAARALQSMGETGPLADLARSDGERATLAREVLGVGPAG